jgi:uncharacterized protein (DUF2267 family)
VNYKEMTRIVSGRTGLTRSRADEVIVATLTILSEQISHSETRDLLAQLPKTLKERVPIDAAQLEMRPIEFVARVADLVEGLTVDDAESYVRAVFATLHDAVNRGEMRDIGAELGAEYADLLGQPVAEHAARSGPPGVMDRVGAVAGAVAQLPGRVVASIGALARARSEQPPSPSPK